MAEAPTAYEFINQRLDRIENKVDSIGSRVISRDEFDRYKADQAVALAKLEAQIATAQTALATYQNQQQDNANKWRLFWSGLALTPLASAAIAFIVSGGFPQ